MLPGAAAPGSLPFAHDGFDSARGPCTFAALRTLLHDDLRGVDASTRVAIAMQNGADLALSLLRVAHWAVAVPLDHPLAAAFVTKFMTEAIANGTLRKAYDNNGLKDTPVRTEVK